MVSPDAASEIACPMVAQAVAFVLQLLPSSPWTPSTYHVAASAGEDSMIRARTGTTLPFNMVTPPSTNLLATIAHDPNRRSPDSQLNGTIFTFSALLSKDEDMGGITSASSTCCYQRTLPYFIS